MKHLAQLNIARFKHHKDDPRLSGFFSRLDRVNAVAERSEGFVWRMQDTPEHDEIAYNLSVWETPEALEKFVWQTVHKKVYNHKHDWFEESSEPYMLMWWIEPGHEPSMEEAMDRLEHLRKHGPSDHAFGWADLPGVELFKSQQCA